jgi:glutamate formiminotransferase
VTLVAARPPLAAFNLELAPPAGLAEARAIAARIREGGTEGLPGVRALGLPLAARGSVGQVSMNIEDPLSVPLARVVAAVAAHAPIAAAEIVGLVPRAALADFPADVPIVGGASGRILEEALGL